jgi:diaminohydroxyphosphoribosylaminopyrimidine deaminase / 5-amino-6-(5-phosphoribosylamino)uracil reductase
LVTAEDATHMRRALELAQRGRGMTHPNPLVGAVVARDGVVIGEGFHGVYGGSHAEVVALQAAGSGAREATLYVTLEPCAHHGKTPPCTEAILAAGIRRVVYAAADPDPVAAGGGEILRAAGVTVDAGVEREAARSLNRRFFVTREEGRTYCALKLALSLDGAITAREGRRTQLTGDAAMAETHRLRAEHDAVLIGSRTAAVDDPLLTVRGVPCRVPPTRVVLDTHAGLSSGSRLLQTVEQAPLWVVVAEEAPDEAVQRLEAAGARVLRAARSPVGLEPRAVLQRLGDEGVRSILVEGGARVAASFLDAGCFDRLYIFLAPAVLGGVAVPGLAPVTAGKWRFADIQRFGDDALLTLDPAHAPREY